MYNFYLIDSLMIQCSVFRETVNDTSDMTLTFTLSYWVTFTLKHYNLYPYQDPHIEVSVQTTFSLISLNLVLFIVLYARD